MFRILILLTMISGSCLAVSESVILFDRAHGQGPVPQHSKKIARELGVVLLENTDTLTKDSLKGVSLLYLRAPNKVFLPSEKELIVKYVNQGGSLFLVMDEEQRQSLDKTEANDLITPFSMMLTGDTPYLHNCGGLTLAGEINVQARELPYSGGRAVVGGTPFAFQIDRDGNPGLPFAAYKSIKDGGRIVVMGEGMATIFMGEKDATRMSGEFRNTRGTQYWGGDSYVFMKEVTNWLVSK